MSDRVTGSDGREHSRQYLLEIAARDYQQFKALISGLKPGFSGPSIPAEWLKPKVAREICMESAVGRFALRYALNAPSAGAFYSVLVI